MRTRADAPTSPASTAPSAPAVPWSTHERGPLEIPTPRGPVSAAIVAVVTGPIGAPPIVSSLDAQVERAVINSPDILTDDDLQLALFFLHALADNGVVGVDGRWAGDAILHVVRSTLEAALDEALRESLTRRGGVADANAADDLARFLADEAQEAELDEFLAIASVSARALMTPELVAALTRVGLDRAAGHYVDAVDVRVLTARTTATMVTAHASRAAAHRRTTATADDLPPLHACITAAARRFGVAADDAVPASPSRSEARQFARDARRLVEHSAAAHALGAWANAQSALRPCDAIEHDRVLSAAVIALRDARPADIAATEFETTRN
jgi:hypothetical protein